MRSLARKSRERARLCVSAFRSIRPQIPGSRRLGIYHLRSDRDPRTSPEAVARAALRDRQGRRRCWRRAGGDAAASSAPATTPATPATTAPAAAPAASGPPARTAAPAPAAPPPPKPDPVYVQAAKQRRKIPFWAMATLSLMPLWGFMYVRAVTEPPETVEGPLGIGVRDLQQLRQLPRRRQAAAVSATRSPVGRCSRPSRTSKTRSATCTTAPRATTPPASRSTATPTAKAARTSPATSA